MLRFPRARQTGWHPWRPGEISGCDAGRGKRLVRVRTTGDGCGQKGSVASCLICLDKVFLKQETHGKEPDIEWIYFTVPIGSEEREPHVPL